MITITLGHYDRETERKICEVRSGISSEEAKKIVDIVRDVRDSMKNTKETNTPTVRASIMIGKVLKQCRVHASASDKNFARICFDVLNPEIHSGENNPEPTKMQALLSKFIEKHCPSD
jgi:ATP-dependent DNA ligase